METYTITGEHVLFARVNGRVGIESKAITLSKKIVLECADEIARTASKENPYTFSNMRLCHNCNNYGFSSIYTLVKPECNLNLCTECANRMRFDGFHIVDQKTMTIRLRRTVKEHKYSPDEIHQRVIKAEKELEVDEEKRKWYLRACRVNICPKCGCKVESYNTNANTLNGMGICSEYRCSKCDFNIPENI